MNAQRKTILFAVLLFILLYIILTLINKYNSTIIPSLTQADRVSSIGLYADITETMTHKKYKPKEFTIVMGPKKFSDKQIKDHLQLYEGYVNKHNEIDEALETVDKSKANQTYSTFRALKLSETFARNGSLLHELYFENIGTGTTMGQKTQEILIKNFGSIENFKQDLVATATAARGWALTCYNLDNQRVQNYLLDAHNEKVPVFVIPLLVIDTYEHAYMIDFGINRKEYLAILWDNIDWNVIEKRLIKWTSYCQQ